MKTEYWILLAVGAYWFFSKQQSGATGSGGLFGGSFTYPPVASGSRSTGSGGTTASGAGMGTSAQGGNIPVAANPANPTWSQASGYYTCSDGTMVNDPSLCPVDASGYITCPDGTMVNDASLCPVGYVDTGDPCDPNSSAYDPSQCGSAGWL